MNTFCVGRNHLSESIFFFCFFFGSYIQTVSNKWCCGMCVHHTAHVHPELWGRSSVQLVWSRTKVGTRGLPTCVYKTLERIQGVCGMITAEQPKIHRRYTVHERLNWRLPVLMQPRWSDQRAQQSKWWNFTAWTVRRQNHIFFPLCLVFLEIAQSHKWLFLHWHTSQQKKYWVSARAQTACCMSVTTVVFSTVGRGREGK